MESNLDNSNLNFSEQTSRDEQGNIMKKYFINNKSVNENVYFTLSDDFYGNIPKKDKADRNEETVKEEVPISNSSIQDNYCNEEDEVLYDMVLSIQEMDEDTAVDFLKDLLEKNNEIAIYETKIRMYEELGKNMIKISGQLETQMENVIDDYSNESNYNDEEFED